MGGDEFIVLLQNTTTEDVQSYEQILRHLFYLTAIKQDYGVDFSMGISLFSELPSNLDDAKHTVDRLMYQSKDRGKSQTTIQLHDKK